MVDIVKIAACGIIAMVLSLQLKSSHGAMAVLLSMAACAAILMVGLGLLSPLLEYMDELCGLADMDPVFLGSLKKVCGTSIITRFVSVFCKDTGEGGIGGAVELCGNIAAVGCALPMLRAVMNTVIGLLGG